jgi:peptide/nickel transport system permease protein
VANLGVSVPVFVLGLVLAYVFAVLLRDTPFALPPSGRTPAGLPITPLAERWGLEGLSGPPRGILDFVSNMYTINFLLTFEFEKLFAVLRHLILPAIALGTIPMAIIARITRSRCWASITSGRPARKGSASASSSSATRCGTPCCRS